MKYLFFILMNFFVLSSFSQDAANPVSVKTVKHCIDEYAFKDFEGVKGKMLYGTEANKDSKNYWTRYRNSFQLGCDSSFVLYTSAYKRYNLEFYYGYDSDAEERILKVIDEVIEYYKKKYKWTVEGELDEDDELVLYDKKDRARLMFWRSDEKSISVLEIFSVRD